MYETADLSLGFEVYGKPLRKLRADSDQIKQILFYFKQIEWNEIDIQGKNVKYSDKLILKKNVSKIWYKTIVDQKITGLFYNKMKSDRCWIVDNGKIEWTKGEG